MLSFLRKSKERLMRNSNQTDNKRNTNIANWNVMRIGMKEEKKQQQKQQKQQHRKR